MELREIKERSVLLRECDKQDDDNKSHYSNFYWDGRGEGMIVEQILFRHVAFLLNSKVNTGDRRKERASLGVSRQTWKN